MDQTKILPNGSIYDQEKDKLYSPTDGYCIEKYHSSDISFFNFYPIDNGSTVVIVCDERKPPTKNELQNKIVYSTMIISVVFLLLTLIIYLMLPELRNRHGKIVMCHVTCMLLAFVALCFLKVPNKINYSTTECSIIGKPISLI